MREEKQLAGQTALLTGGSRGIGLAIARTLGEMGARIALCGRRAEALEAAAKQIRSEGVEVFAHAADVSRAEEVARLVERTNAALGDIEILVNNAGIGVFGPFYEKAEEDWDRVMDINLKGAFLCSRAVAPQMIRRRSGHIINISSLAGKNTFAGGGIYCASKWGLQGLSGSMAEDLRGYGIRVATICPGSVHTEFSPHAGKDAAKLLQAEDVAHVVGMMVTQRAGSFVSDVEMRPTQKP